MSMTPADPSRPVRLLVMSGSSRTGSYNGVLAGIAEAKARAQGAEVTRVDLRELGLPVYDEDLAVAQGTPVGALRLRELFAAHDGLLLSCPEYNALPTPLLINSFDWLSTVSATDALPSGTGATGGKPAGLMAASPGALGGIRALPIVRTYLSTNFAMVVVPEQLALPLADQVLAAPAVSGAGAGDEPPPPLSALPKPQLDQVLDKIVASVIRQARWRLADRA